MGSTYAPQPSEAFVYVAGERHDERLAAFKAIVARHFGCTQGWGVRARFFGTQRRGVDALGLDCGQLARLKRPCGGANPLPRLLCVEDFLKRMRGPRVCAA